MDFDSGSLDGLRAGMLTLVGMPSDENSTFMRGPALAPARIREVLYNGSANLYAENGIDLGTEPHFRDLGDLTLENRKGAFQHIEQTVGSLLDRDVQVLTLGGDHAITYPIVRAYAAKYPGLSILQFDAHPDLYDEYEGNRYAHACPFARIMEEELASRLVQVGIRTMNSHQRDQAARFGVEVIEMRHWRPGTRLDLQGPVYLSLDMDALDPAYAPGVSHHEPGGLSTREVLHLIQELDAAIVGADIVEVNPTRDPHGITAMVGAKFLKEIAGCLLA